MFLFAIWSKTTDGVNSFIGNGLDYLVVGLADDNESVRHDVVRTPTSNEIQNGGEQSSNEQSSNEQSSSSSNNTDNPGSSVVSSGKFVVSLTSCIVL
jgi:hypothetical protein